MRLVAAFNKEKSKSIAKEKALNSLRTVAVHNQPAAASCCHMLLDCCCKTYNNTVFTSKKAYVIVDIRKNI